MEPSEDLIARMKVGMKPSEVGASGVFLLRRISCVLHYQIMSCSAISAGIGPVRRLRHRWVWRNRRKRIHESPLPAGLSQNVQKSFWHDLRGLSSGDLEVSCSMCSIFKKLELRRKCSAAT